MKIRAAVTAAFLARIMRKFDTNDCVERRILCKVSMGLICCRMTLDMTVGH